MNSARGSQTKVEEEVPEEVPENNENEELGEDNNTNPDSGSEMPPVPPQDFTAEKFDYPTYVNALNAANYQVTVACEANTTLTLTYASLSQEVACVNGQATASFDLSGVTTPEVVIEVFATNSASHSSATFTITIPVDVAPPSLTLTSPTDNTAVDYEIVISGTCSEEGKTVSYTIAGDLREETSCTNKSFSFDAIIPGPNGAVVLQFSHADAAGNVATKTLTLNRNYLFVDGNGSVDFPFEIATCDDLQAIQTHADTATLVTQHFKLANDVDCSVSATWDSGAGFTPIQNFAGTLDGNGKTISGLMINRPSTLHVGMISNTIDYTELTTVIKNLSLSDINMVGDWYMGSLIAVAGNNVKLENVHLSSGLIKGTMAGGLVGSTSDSDNIYIDNCTNSAIVYAEMDAGGIIGEAYQSNLIEVNDCHNFGRVYSETDNAAGIIAVLSKSSSAKVSLSSNYGLVQSDGYGIVAGIVDVAGSSFNGLLIDQCANFGPIYTGNYGGGIMGFMATGSNLTIQNSFNSGSIFGTSEGAGGIVGWGSSTSNAVVQKTYNTGSVSIPYSPGGVVGDYQQSALYIHDSFSVGPVIGVDFAGGMSGKLGGWTDCIIDNTAWLPAPSLYSGAIGDNSGGCVPSLISLGSADEMKDPINEPLASWDFTDIWKSNLANSDYPSLKSLKLFGNAETSCFQNGSGTDADPYLISSCECLQEIETNYLIKDLRKKSFALSQDITCTGEESWNYGLGYLPIQVFSGHFDGRGYKISDLTINGYDNVGVFGSLMSQDSQRVVVENLKLENLSVTSQMGYNGGNAGGLVGSLGGNIILSRIAIVSGSVTGSTRTATGGIVGAAYFNGSKIVDSYNNASVSAGGTYGCAGGLLGKLITVSATTPIITFENVYNSGSVSAKSSCSGGIIGEGEIQASNVFSLAQDGETRKGIGGKVPTAGCSISNVYWQSSSTVTLVWTDSGSCGAPNLTQQNTTTYYYDDANEPLASWNFTNTWQVNAGALPTLK